MRRPYGQARHYIKGKMPYRSLAVQVSIYLNHPSWDPRLWDQRHDFPILLCLNSRPSNPKKKWFKPLCLGVVCQATIGNQTLSEGASLGFHQPGTGLESTNSEGQNISKCLLCWKAWLEWANCITLIEKCSCFQVVLNINCQKFNGLMFSKQIFIAPKSFRKTTVCLIH